MRKYVYGIIKYKCYTPISRHIAIFTIEYEFDQKIIKTLNDT